jgi:exosortase/archaeosortase family protein
VGPNGGGWSVYENGESKVFIGDACNARNIFFLYIGFLVSIPMGTSKRKIQYLVIGLLLIFLFNVIRVFLLFLLAANMPAIFEFTHKYLFQISIYVLLFYLWHRYLTPFSQSESKV